VPRRGWSLGAGKKGPQVDDRIEDVTGQLAEDLRLGRFPPGAWLKQIDLQRRYGAGRSTIRKALESLAVRRLVRHEKNKGYSVYPHDDDETKHVLELRATIESGFAAQIVQNAAAAEIGALQSLAEDFLRMAEEGRYVMLYPVNLEFHRTLLGCARNPVMLSQIEELRIRISPAPVSQWPDQAAIKASADEHFRIVAALRARAADTLRDLIRKHILK